MERGFVESSTAKPYANELGILGSMMGNTMIQQQLRRCIMHDVILNATRSESREDVRVRRSEVGVQKTNVATAIQSVLCQQG